MTTFIRLTMTDDRPVYIKSDLIRTFNQYAAYNNEMRTFVQYGIAEDQSIMVKETVDHIVRLLDE